MLQGILFGISYFTILPIKADFKDNQKFFQGLIYSLFFSGIILAFILVLLFYLLPFEDIFKSILIAIIYPFLYGFLHFEAIIDTVDGLFGSLSNKDYKKIMKEPFVGAIGVMQAVGIYLIKITLISYILYKNLFVLLFIVLSISRISIILSFDYNFSKGFASSLAKNYKKSIFDYLLIFFKPFYKFILNKITKFITEINGDVLGFMIEVSEIFLLFLGVSLARI